ncbi:MAG: hypothetical protein ABI583_07305, partial [Betaproteobacteria bacterium]
MTTFLGNVRFATVNFCTAFTVALLCVIATLFVPSKAQSQGFSAVISPPRFETTVQAGKTSRQIIEITHVANQPGKYRVYTNDWVLGPDGSAIFSDELAPNSCRPWVALEKRELSLPANGKIRFRFEITPPADAASVECRFAVMIEGFEQVIKTEGAVSFPVSGRVGVVVYAIVGDAAPKLAITMAGTTTYEGNLVPQLQVSNSGNAHGRLGGFVTGVDATGQKIDFVPESLPIMPAQTRPIPLVPNVPGGGTTKLNYPLTVTGNLE